MTPRIGLDLEPGLLIAKTLPDLDLLDVAYGATHGGVQSLLAPLSAFAAGTPYSAEHFFRPGLPLFMVKAERDQQDKILELGTAPDRVLLTGVRGHAVADWDRVADFVKTVGAFAAEIGVLIEPEAGALRELSRLRAQWAFFSTEQLYRASSLNEAEAEVARLNSAAVGADKLNLRVALHGPTGRHLPASFGHIPRLEEVYPTPDLWNLALRLGWERAVAEYSLMLR